MIIGAESAGHAVAIYSKRYRMDVDTRHRERLHCRKIIGIRSRF
jgi:hypothetical protein